MSVFSAFLPLISGGFMAAPTAYRRAPLVDPVYVPLTDAAVNTDGLIKLLASRVLKMINVEKLAHIIMYSQ